ncbi:unnamed protein product [Meganyctiphanes norvegica]|uniref:Uncharacterized protein n=2 Tax=Meganyctiphanes norvegica TaxID=48144 RepID=A0AAV2S979_MEGNR
MVNELCNKCNRAIVLDGENLCPYCILSPEKRDENTLDVNCGICKTIVEEDSEGLFCDVCNSWFHNDCNKTPLEYELYALLDGAPKNVKWFCDKCIWETDKWIKDVNNKKYNISNDNGKLLAHLKFEESDHSLEFDDCVPTEDSEEFINLEQKNKRKKKPNVQSISDVVRTSSKTIATENILNRLDITPEKLSNITDAIISVKKTRHIRSQCNLCPKSFIHLAECIAHILSDHEGVQNPYKCSVCKTVWLTKSALHKHIRTHTRHEGNDAEFGEANDPKESDDDYIEDGADSASDSEGSGSSDYHTNSHKKYQCSAEKPFKCSHCEKPFAQSADLEKHIKTHSKEKLSDHDGVQKPFKCSVCNTVLETRSALNTHMKIHTRHEGNYAEFVEANDPQDDDHIEDGADSTSDSEGSGSSDSQTNSHKKYQCSGEKPFKCSHCNRTFAQKAYLKNHIKIHSTEKPYQDSCTEEPFKLFPLNNHLSSHAKEKRYQCNHCDRAFNKYNWFMKHIGTHTGDKPYLCNQCGKAFSHNWLLNKHFKNHTSEKPFICNHCDMAFKENNKLQLHLRTHTGEKPYLCNQCGKVFAVNKGLKRHLLTHTGEKPYKCHLCDNTFRRNDQLISHLRIHTGEKPYRCSHCGKGYSHNCQLKTHLKTHTEGKNTLMPPVL